MDAYELQKFLYYEVASFEIHLLCFVCVYKSNDVMMPVGSSTNQ